MKEFRIWIDMTNPIKTVNDCKNSIKYAKRYCIYSAQSHDCYWFSDTLENCDNTMLNYTVKNISIDEDGFIRLWVNEL